MEVIELASRITVQVAAPSPAVQLLALASPALPSLALPSPAATVVALPSAIHLE